MTGTDQDLAALVGAAAGIASLYPARRGPRMLAAVVPAAAFTITTTDSHGTRVELSVGLDGTVPAPDVGRHIAALVAATVEPRPDGVIVRVVAFD